MMGYGYGSSMGGFGMGFGMIAFTVLIIMAAIWMFKAASRGGSKAEEPTGSLGILKERYAKGEINGEEYQQMKKELE